MDLSTPSQTCQILVKNSSELDEEEGNGAYSSVLWLILCNRRKISTVAVPTLLTTALRCLPLPSEIQFVKKKMVLYLSHTTVYPNRIIKLANTIPHPINPPIRNDVNLPSPPPSTGPKQKPCLSILLYLVMILVVLILEVVLLEAFATL